MVIGHGGTDVVLQLFDFWKSPHGWTIAGSSVAFEGFLFYKMGFTFHCCATFEVRMRVVLGCSSYMVHVSWGGRFSFFIVGALGGRTMNRTKEIMAMKIVSVEEIESMVAGLELEAGLGRESAYGNFRMPTPRDIPAGSREEVDEASGTVFYLWENGDKFLLKGYQGKSSKPIANYYFRSESSRSGYMEKLKDQYRSRQESKDQRKQERAEFKHELKVGDILDSSWGYDQTNVDFYQVISVTDKSVVIREIGSRTVRSDGSGSDYVVPVPDHFTGKAMVKRVSPRNTLRLTSYSSADKWDGSPQRQTSSGWGH
jgi:hypothetical protein